jgi:pantothenate kinase type III
MRLMALSHYTARLPDASPHPMPTETPPGQSSLSSLQVGAYHGIIAEAQYWIDYYRDLFGPSLYAVVTGRDSEVFEKNLKSVNFATPFLALHGTLSLMRRRFQ